MSELNLLKKMAREANVPHFDITKGKIEGLSKIVETEVPLGPAEWDELVKREDPLVYCAILADQRAPSDIKIEAIHGIRRLIDSNKKVFLPMLFDKDKNIFDLLTRKASFELAESIKWGAFNDKLLMFLSVNPDTKELPFAGTHVEEFLLTKLINGGILTGAEENDYASYTFIEHYSDEETLEEIIDEYTSQNECVITGVMNNKFVSMDTRKKAFLIGADFRMVNTEQDIEIAKEMYRSSVYGIDRNCDDTTAMSAGTMCIQSMIHYNLLPESCELDLLRKFCSNEIKIDIKLIEEMIEKSKNLSVVTEAANLPKAKLVIAAIKNPILPNDVLEGIMEKELKSSEANRAKAITTSKKEKFVQLLRHGSFTESTYERLGKVFSDERFIFDKMVSTSIKTPKDILNKVATHPKMNAWNQMFAIANGNLPSEFSLAEKRRFMSTLEAVASDCLAGYGHLIVIPEGQFLPKYDTLQNEKLREVLQVMIDSKQGAAEKCAKHYLKTLDKKDMYEKAKDNIGKRKIDELSIEEIQTEKEAILDSIFEKHPAKIHLYGKDIEHKDVSSYGNYYSMFRILEGLIKNSERYEQLEIKEKDIASKETMKMFMGEER